MNTIDLIQIGAHHGNTLNDPIYKNTQLYKNMILIEPVPYLFTKLKSFFNYLIIHLNFKSFIFKLKKYKIILIIQMPIEQIYILIYKIYS